MKIHGLQKLTLLDFPGRVGCTLFTGHCNFRCPFCQNGNLVLSPESEPVIPEEEVFGFLKKRRGLLDGVCITGGEPTLWPDLPDFIRKIRGLGYAVKLDTNGYRPEILKSLVEEGLLDYVAMDLKNDPEHYAKTCGLTDMEVDRIRESVQFLMEGRIPYEFRTTVMREFHDEEHFRRIGTWIRGAEQYYLQCYRDSEAVICPGFTAYSKEELEHFREILAEYDIGQLGVRGIS